MAAPAPEGSCDHPATKADVEGVRMDMERNRAEYRADMERIRADIARRLFLFGVAVISAVGVATGIILAVIKLT